MLQANFLLSRVLYAWGYMGTCHYFKIEVTSMRNSFAVYFLENTNV